MDLNEIYKVSLKSNPIERKKEFRDCLMNFEKILEDHPDSYGDPSNAGRDEVANQINTLKHTFCDGTYSREITMLAGQLISSGIHKIKHCYFVLKGDVSVLTENGVERIRAPYSGVTMPGTKRLLFTHEETVWTTVHATEKQTVDEVLEEVLAENFNDPDIKAFDIKEQELFEIENNKKLKL